MSLVEIENAEMARQQAEERFQEHRESERRRRMISVVEWLAPVDTNGDQDRYMEVRRQYPGTCDWIHTEPTIKAWQDSSLKKDAGIWLYGIPGAGMWLLDLVLYRWVDGVCVTSRKDDPSIGNCGRRTETRKCLRLLLFLQVRRAG